MPPGTQVVTCAFGPVDGHGACLEHREQVALQLAELVEEQLGAPACEGDSCDEAPAYEKVAGGYCADGGYADVETVEGCQLAAAALELPWVAAWPGGDGEWQFCLFAADHPASTGVYFNENTFNENSHGFHLKSR